MAKGINRMKIAITGDGDTDREVFETFIQKIFDSKSIEVTFLYKCPNGQDIFTILRKNELNPKIKDRIAREFSNAIWAGYQEWTDKAGVITWNDIFIYQLDTERLVINTKEIIKGWAREILEAIWRGVDLFYLSWGNRYRSLCFLPKIFPIVCFPSTEIITGACVGEEIRGKRAHELKINLYGTANLASISKLEFYNKLKEIFSKDKKEYLELFAKVPEIYRFLFLITF